MRALVTGASRGLGLALCRVLADRGDEVLAACRRATPELARLGVTVIEGIDVAEDASITRLAEAAGAEPIDLVVCNAGINVTYAQGIEEIDTISLMSEFAVNTVGPVRTLQAVLPRLREGSKVALISTYRPGVGLAKRNYGYQSSKMAMNQLGYILADELAERGIVTVILSPGPMDTDLLREIIGAGHANLTPAQAQDPLDVAHDLLAQLDGLTPEDAGSWLFRSGERLTLPTAVFGH
jgi:NAD(P)-dependent dehydrogenase (short-subunit alcohol dehydrogenase family)